MLLCSASQTPCYFPYSRAFLLYSFSLYWGKAEFLNTTRGSLELTTKRILSRDAPSYLMHSRFAKNAYTFNSDIMDHNERILSAIADLNLQEVPNYGATAKKYNLVRTTLWRRHTPQTVSRREATTEFRQALNEAQEKVLLGYIRRLVTRGTPPTPSVVRNIAEEIHKGELGKHWVGRFI